MIESHNSRKRDAVAINGGRPATYSSLDLGFAVVPNAIAARAFEFAECDESQSGQRFLDGSAPRLRRHVAGCETAVGGKDSPTADKDQKPSRVFEGRALIGGAAAVPLSCFIKKRVIVTDAPYRKRGCGAWTVRGCSLHSSVDRFIRLNCKCWDCRYCGPRRAKRYRRAIGIWAVERGLNRFLTLTLDPKKLNGEDSTKYLKRTWNKLRSLIHRKYGKSLPYICVLEYQKNGMAHLHILLNQRIEIDWLKNKWQAVGGGWNVWIKMVPIQRIVNYVSKYLSKDLILSAPKGARRVTTSRDIQLFEKPTKDAAWSLIRASIDRVRLTFVSAITETFCEIQGILTMFTVATNVA